MKLIYLILALMCCPAFAQNKVCDELNTTVDNLLKKSAIIYGLQTGESVDVRLYSQVRISNNLSEVQSNLFLMKENNCTPRTSAVDYMVYAPRVEKCEIGYCTYWDPNSIPTK